MLNPKHSAKYVCRAGTPASSTARAVTSYKMIRQRTRSTSSQFLTSFLFSTIYIRKGRPHGHRYGKKEGDQEYHTANQLQKKCKKREFLSIHDRFIRDARFRKTMIELGRTEEVIREMDKLANEDHTHHCYRRRTRCISVATGGSVRIFVGSDTMPIRHRADFKEALSTLRRLKNEEDRAYYQNGWR